MTRPSIHAYYVSLLGPLAARSTCVRRAVGAILTDERGRVLATGYNGVPRGRIHCIDAPCEGARDEKGDTRRCLAIHAEINALVQCRDIDAARTLYVSASPCFECAKVVANTPVCHVVVAGVYADGRGVAILRDAGVTVSIVDPAGREWQHP